ncbi:MAG: hypothetical protein ACLT2Z_00065 [Eubacterium sp.]
MQDVVKIVCVMDPRDMEKDEKEVEKHTKRLKKWNRVIAREKYRIVYHITPYSKKLWLFTYD